MEKTIWKEIKKRFNWVDPNADKFPLEERKHGKYKLYNFNRFISSEDAIKEMEKDGFMPANALELVEWKEWNERDFVVALGSVAEVGSSRKVLCLYRRGSKRFLDLFCFEDDWCGGFRFLAVRNLKSEPNAINTSALGNSDTLKLEERVKNLEEQMLKIRKFLNLIK